MHSRSPAMNVNAIGYSGLEDRYIVCAIAVVDQVTKAFSSMMPPRYLSYLRVLKLNGGVLSFTALQDPCAVSESTIASAVSLPFWHDAPFSSPALNPLLP